MPGPAQNRHRWRAGIGIGGRRNQRERRCGWGYRDWCQRFQSINLAAPASQQTPVSGHGSKHGQFARHAIAKHRPTPGFGDLISRTGKGRPRAAGSSTRVAAADSRPMWPAGPISSSAHMGSGGQAMPIAIEESRRSEARARKPGAATPRRRADSAREAGPSRRCCARSRCARTPYRWPGRLGARHDARRNLRQPVRRLSQAHPAPRRAGGSASRSCSSACASRSGGGIGTANCASPTGPAPPTAGPNTPSGRFADHPGYGHPRVYAGDETQPRELFSVVSGLEGRSSCRARRPNWWCSPRTRWVVPAWRGAARSLQRHVASRGGRGGRQRARPAPSVTGLAEPVGTWAQLNESDLAFLRRLVGRFDSDLQIVGEELQVAPAAGCGA